MVLYGIASFYFARKMNRLIILSGPIASMLAGVALDYALRFCWAQLSDFALGAKVEKVCGPTTAAPVP